MDWTGYGVHAFHFSTRVTDAGGLRCVRGQFGLHKESRDSLGFIIDPVSKSK